MDETEKKIILEIQRLIKEYPSYGFEFISVTKGAVPFEVNYNYIYVINLSLNYPGSDEKAKMGYGVSSISMAKDGFDLVSEIIGEVDKKLNNVSSGTKATKLPAYRSGFPRKIKPKW